MNKSGLVVCLSERTGVSRLEAYLAIEALFGVPHGIIAEELSDGREVEIDGFGAFCVDEEGVSLRFEEEEAHE